MTRALSSSSSRLVWALALGLVVQACSGQPFVVEVPLRVVATSPSGGATAVARTALVIVRFSEPIQQPGSDAVQLIEVDANGSETRLKASAAYSEKDGQSLLELTPAVRFGFGRTIRLVLDTSITRARDGAKLPTRVEAEFTTELPPALLVVASTPGNGATRVDRAQPLSVRFSEPVRCSSLGGVQVTETYDPHTVSGGDAQRTVAGSWDCRDLASDDPERFEGGCTKDGKDLCTVTFKPTDPKPWRNGSRIAIALPGAGNSAPVTSARALGTAGVLAADQQLAFEIAHPDPLALVGAHASTGARNTTFELDFSEPPHCETFANTVVMKELRDGTTTASAIAYDLACPQPLGASETCATPGRCTATLTPKASFDFSSLVTLELAGGAITEETPGPFLESARATSHGGQLPSPQKLSFRIEDPPPLLLAGTTPAAGATYVDASTHLDLRAADGTGGFDCPSLQQHLRVVEALDPFFGEDPTAADKRIRMPIAGTVTCTQGAQTARWSADPVNAAPFAFHFSSRVEVVLAGGDFAHAVQSALATSRGGQLPAPGVQFAFDIEPPAPLHLVTTSPSDQATGVPTDASFVAQFDRAIDCAKVVLGTNLVVEQSTPELAAGSLAGPFLPVTGRFVCDASDPTRLRFSADNAFVPSTSVRVTLGVRDPATTLRSKDATSRGGGLETPIVVRYRIADPAPLRVVAINPSGAPALDVASSSQVRVTFDRPIDCASAFDPLGQWRVRLFDETAQRPLAIAAVTCGNGQGQVGATGAVLMVTPAAGAFVAGNLVSFTIDPGVLAADATVVAGQAYGRLPQQVGTTLRIGYAPLQLVASTPRDGDQQVPFGSELRLSFDQPIDETSFIACTARSTPAGCNVLLASGTDPSTATAVALTRTAYDANTRTVSFRPASDLVRGQAYVLVVSDQQGKPVGLNGRSTLPAPLQLDFRVATTELVRSTLPENGSTNVSLSVKPCVTFIDTVGSLANKPLAATLTDRFGRTIALPLDQATPYLVSDSDGRTGNRVCLHLAPTRLDSLPGDRTLLYNKEITVTAATGLQVGASTLSAPYAFTFRTGQPPSLVSLGARNQVVQLDSLDGGKDVPVRLEFLVHLARDVDLRTASAITLKKGTSTIPFDLVDLAARDTVRLTLAQPLDFDADYVLAIAGGTGGLADLQGNPLEAAVSAAFHTSRQTTVRIGPPETQLLPGTTIPLVFSRPLFLPSATSGTIRAFVGDPVPALIAQSAATPRTVQLVPQPTWPKGAASASVEVTAGVLDERGNPVQPTRSIHWTVGNPPTSTLPGAIVASGLNLQPNGAISADQQFVLELPNTSATPGLTNRFLPQAFTNETIALSAVPGSGLSGCPVAGLIPLDIRYELADQPSLRDRVVFTPANPTGTTRVRSGCTYQLNIVRKNLANLFFTAYTDALPAAPQLTLVGESTRPTASAASVRLTRLNGAQAGLDTAPTDVSALSPLVVTFSEPIDPATVTAQTFVVSRAGAVPGTLQVEGTTATFTPAAPLVAGATYQVLLRASASGLTGISDLAGNALAQDVAGSFTVESQAPTFDAVARTSDGALRLTFSESIDAASLVSSTTTQPGTVRVRRTTGTPEELFGTLSTDPASPRAVLFTPADALPSGATLEVTATTGVRDSARTALASDTTRSLAL